MDSLDDMLGRIVRRELAIALRAVAGALTSFELPARMTPEELWSSEAERARNAEAARDEFVGRMNEVKSMKGLTKAERTADAKSEGRRALEKMEAEFKAKWGDRTPTTDAEKQDKKNLSQRVYRMRRFVEGTGTSGGRSTSKATKAKRSGRRSRSTVELRAELAELEKAYAETEGKSHKERREFYRRMWRARKRLEKAGG